MNSACGRLELPFNSVYSQIGLDLYSIFNKEYFEDIRAPSLLKSTIDLICSAHKQNPSIQTIDSLILPTFANNKRVLVLFSGGLDSAYQALKLRDDGYDVSLLHVKNLNFYTNGQEAKCAEAFSQKYGFKLFEPKFSAVVGKNPNKKFWPENSFKNTLLYLIAVDCMKAYNITYLSGGDDFRLDINDSVMGVNTADSKQISQAFFTAFNITYLPVTENKAERLAYMTKKGARDDFNSCVMAGRLTKSTHLSTEKKYNVHLDAWNCGSCRKCCSHVLYDYYVNKTGSYSQEFLDHCWERVSTGADEKFFKGKTDRREALLNY